MQNMQDDRGSTFLELVVALAILSYVGALATLSAVGFISSARTAKEAARLADGISKAREMAIARYERWRIRFLPNPVAGSTVLRSYVLESCQLPACAAWTVQSTLSVEPGTGLVVPEAAGTPIDLTFDRTGLFLNTEDAQIEICRMETNGSGAEVCRTGSLARVVRVRKYSGIIET